MTIQIEKKTHHMVARKNGFTTMELIAGVTILSLLSLVTLQTIIMSQVIWDNSFTQLRLQKEAARATTNIVKNLREADPSSPIGITIPPEADTVTFAIPQTVASGEITGWQQISFQYDDVNQEITRTADGNTEVIARMVTSVQFSQAANRVSVVLTTAGNTSNGRPLSVSLSTEATMRN